ncbi:papain fold toxin domain-containing protein, partial [Breznakia sp. PM6-1]
KEETGLIYLRARYYDPSIGNFIQIDNNYAGEKEDVGTQNRYNYTLSNPYKYVDRDGNKAKKPKKTAKKPNIASSLVKGTTNIINKANNAAKDGKKKDPPKTFDTTIGTQFDPSILGTVGGLVIGWINPFALIITAAVMVACVGFAGSFQDASRATESVYPPHSQDGAIQNRDLGNYNIIKNKLKDIAGKFDTFKCVEATKAMVSYLKNNKIKYELITIDFSDKGFIWSDIKKISISENGHHEGIVIDEYSAFCNVHPYGLPVKNWIRDFHGQGIKTVNPAKYKD